MLIDKIKPSRRVKYSLYSGVSHSRASSKSLSLVAGVLLLLIGLCGPARWWSGTHSVTKPIAAESNNPVSPEETKIDPDQSYKVAADLPRSIDLPTIGAKGFIQKVRLDKNQAMGVPSNLFMAGWFVGSVKPGEAGLSIIDGHVQGKYQPGIFKGLTRLRPGDEFAVEFGDHSLRKFKVITANNYEMAKAQEFLFAKDPKIERQLNLITCSGTYDSKTATYNKRFIVSAQSTAQA